MLPIERRRQIMKWLKEEQSLSIKALSERLQISEMTVYRDIKPLLDSEDIYRTPGGIACARNPITAVNIVPIAIRPSVMRG
ncbi:DeoR family transcriptional regulator [Terrilactibacillus sp. S3-3]|nr:DeoR family transcriptional regulator [Terrilactibacillus sp. S3-3]